MTEARIELPPLPRRGVKTAVWSGRPIKCVSLKAMREYARAAVLQERERCARVCEAMMDPQDDGWDSCLREVASLIRKGD